MALRFEPSRFSLKGKVRQEKTSYIHVHEHTVREEVSQVWNKHKRRRYKKQSQVLVLGPHKRRLNMNRGTRSFDWRKRHVKSNESDRGCKTKPTNQLMKLGQSFSEKQNRTTSVNLRFIVTLVEGYIPVVIGSKAIVRKWKINNFGTIENRNIWLVIYRGLKKLVSPKPKQKLVWSSVKRTHKKRVQKAVSFVWPWDQTKEELNVNR